MLYPPRPHNAARLKSHNLLEYEKSGNWVAQYKFNGTRNVVNIKPNGKVEFWNRHGTHHKQYNPTDEIIKEFRSLNLEKGKEYWLDGELLHAKTKNIKGKIVVYDVLFAGKYFFGGPPQIERLEILKNICGNPQKLEPKHGIALQVSNDIWMAETFDKDFLKHYEKHIHTDEIEGLVLRRKDGVILSLGTKEYDVDWQLRCRKPSKNYNL